MVTREEWERYAEWPLAGAAVLFLAAYAWPILDVDLRSGLVMLCRVVTWLVWLVFAVDYAVRLALAEDRRRWFVRSLVDLVILALPLFRPLRLLRLVTLIRVLNRRARHGLRGRVAVYVASGSAMLAFVASLAVLDAERGEPGANIERFGTAVWWSITTMTTVGYGDHYPVTGTGHLVGVLLMVGGIALLGTVTATFASWLVDAVQAYDDEEDASETEALRAEVERLRLAVERLAGQADGAPSPSGEADD